MSTQRQSAKSSRRDFNRSPSTAVEVNRSGAVAGNDMTMSGTNVAGRDLILHEGLALKSRMTRGAKRTLKAGLVLILAGMVVLVGWIISYQGVIFDMIGNADPNNPPDFGSLPSFVPWVPLGMALFLAGITTVVGSLLAPREKIVTAA